VCVYVCVRVCEKEKEIQRAYACVLCECMYTVVLCAGAYMYVHV